MNRVKSFGIHTTGTSDFDRDIRAHIVYYIESRAELLERENIRVTRGRLAELMGIDRERLARICKKLNIINIFK